MTNNSCTPKKNKIAPRRLGAQPHAQPHAQPIAPRRLGAQPHAQPHAIKLNKNIFFMLSNK